MHSLFYIHWDTYLYSYTHRIKGMGICKPYTYIYYIYIYIYQSHASYGIYPSPVFFLNGSDLAWKGLKKKHVKQIGNLLSSFYKIPWSNHGRFLPSPVGCLDLRSSTIPPLTDSSLPKPSGLTWKSNAHHFKTDFKFFKKNGPHSTGDEIESFNKRKPEDTCV